MPSKTKTRFDQKKKTSNYSAFGGGGSSTVGGGGFSLGCGVGDKTNRRFVRVRRKGPSTSDASCVSCPASPSTSKNPSTSATDVPGERNTDPNKDQTVEQAISLKVIIQKKNKKLLFVQCNKDFVDVIFGFLTLPIGSILRLLKGVFPAAAAIGCLRNIYGSVGKLNICQFKTEACKPMLLEPRVSSKTYLQNLKLKIVDEKAEKFYFCQNEACRKEGKTILSEFPNFRCYCGRMMDQVASFVEPFKSAVADDEGSVFIREGTECFLLGDDMQVMPGLGSITVLLLKQFGIGEVKELEIRDVDVGNKEILKLLRLILVSETPLTNWIFEESTSLEPQNITEPLRERCTVETSQRMNLTLFFCKSLKKVLYADCREEFVDFLFSFLTFPLGSVPKVLDGKSQVACLDNIYKSVADLSAHGYFKSEEAKDMILCPKFPPQVAYKNNLLQVEETSHPQYALVLVGAFGSKPEWSVYPVQSTPSDILLQERAEVVSAIVNPKSSDGKATCNGGFIKGSARFLITDELVITSFSSAAMLSLIDELDVAITDIDPVTVQVGEEEAKHLLRAALLSKTALNEVFRQTCLDQLESKNLGEDLETLKI